MISLEEIKAKQDEVNEKKRELNKMMEEYKKTTEYLMRYWVTRRLDYNDTYYYIDLYRTIKSEDICNDDEKIQVYENNRVFIKKELAEKWLEIDEGLKVLSFNPDWKNENEVKYSILYNTKEDKFEFEPHYITNNFAQFYFEDEEIKEIILKKYSKEELKFYFNIRWEIND